MKRNRFLLYVLLSGMLVAVALFIYVYGEYMGEDTDPSLSSGLNPIINQKINGIVTRTTLTKIDQQQKLAVSYRDVQTQQTSNFRLDTTYQQRLHPGDTVTKDKGEKVLLVNQKSGETAIVPID